MAKDMREQILTEALIELNRHGADFHMDDLARQLRISKRTLYQHFTSKQEIVEKAILSAMTDVYRKHVDMLNDTSLTAEEKIIGYFTVRSRYEKVIEVCSVRQVSDVFLKMPEVGKNLSKYYERDWAVMDKILDELKGSNGFINFDKLLLMHMLRSAAEDVLAYINDIDRDYSFPEYMEKCLTIILYGIKDRRKNTNDTEA